MINPTNILKIEDAFLPSNFLFAQNLATVVPIMIIKSADKDWNHDAGTSIPINILLVFSLAYRFSKPPACSYAPQKTITIKNEIKRTMILSFSILVSGFFNSSFSFLDFESPIKFPISFK